MNRSIGNLAAAIEKDWSLSGHAACAFPAIAAKHLSGPLDLDLGTLIRDLSSARSLPSQRLLDQSFGQPQVTLYSSELFQIEVLFWHSGTPAIHEHAFDGAFRLLAGRSAHCKYRFEPERQLDRVTIGQLTMMHFELLTTGSGAKIPRGSELIHSAFHIDSPSMTLVARTHQDDLPELTYLPPGVAYDPAARSALLHKKLQLLDTLAITAYPDYREAALAAIEVGDVYDGLAVLIRAGGHAIEEQTFRAIADGFRARHEACEGIGTVISAGFAERRRSRLVQLRHSMTEPDLRFFLATLLCFTDQTSLFEALEDYAGSASAAHDLIIAGVGRLIGGDADRQTLARVAAAVRLSDHSVATFVQTVTAMQGTELSDKEKEGLERFYHQLLKHWVLTPLFEEPEGAARAAE